MQRFFFTDGETTIELKNVTGVAGLDMPPRKIVTSQGFEQDGVTVRSITFAERPFSISLDMRGKNYAEAVEQRRELSRFFGTRKPKKFIYDRDDYQLFLEDVYMTQQFETGGKELHILSGVLQFVAANPFFQREINIPSVPLEEPLLEFMSEGIEFDLTNGTGGLEFSLMMDQLTVYNGGNEYSPAVFRITAPANNPYIINETTGQKIEVIRELTEGQVLEINSKTGRIDIIDPDGTRHNAFHYISDDPEKSSFIMYAPGENIISFGNAGGSMGYLQVAGFAYYTSWDA